MIFFSLTISLDSKGDEFPWVQQILFQDTITWIVTNEGLYKIIQKKNRVIQWTKELNSASNIYIDSKNTIWVTDFGNGIYINKSDKWTLIQNDTVKHIYNIYEYDANIYALASLNNEMRYLRWDNGKWKEITTFNPPNQNGKERAYGLVVNRNGIYSANSFYDDSKRDWIDNFYRFDFEKWHMLKQGVKNFYFDKKNNIWMFFFGFHSDKIEVNNAIVKIPHGELIQHYDVDRNGTPWILTKNGLFFSYSNNQWIKRNDVINPVQNSSLKFWVKNEKELWVGGYAYVAYFLNNQWVELSFLTPQPDHEEPEDESDADQSKSITENYKWGVINDVDGYSNLRKSPDSKSEVIAKILTNFKFKYYEDNKTDWWKVETERGTTGYIHKSRITAL